MGPAATAVGPGLGGSMEPCLGSSTDPHLRGSLEPQSDGSTHLRVCSGMELHLGSSMNPVTCVCHNPKL